MRNRILILIAALAMAGLSGTALLAYTRSADERAVAGKQGVWVLLAKERIAADTGAADIRANHLTERVLMPAETVPRGALAEVDASLDGLRLTADLQPRQLLLREQFAEPAQHDGRLAVPPGKLAVSVELAVAPQVAGNVAAGDQVTVFDTYPAAPDAGQEQVTRILLPRVTVVSIGTSSPTPAPEGAIGATAAGGSGPYVVTLAVGQDDAERLVHAARTGLLYLGLLDESTPVTAGRGVDDDGLFS